MTNVKFPDFSRFSRWLATPNNPSQFFFQTTMPWALKQTNTAINILTHPWKIETQQENMKHKPVGDWISAPSPNFIATATRVGPTTFCMVPCIPQNPLVGPNISGLSAIQAGGRPLVGLEPLPVCGWPTFPSVLWCCWLGLLTCKNVSRITYTVLVETLNPAQSNPSHTSRLMGDFLQILGSKFLALRGLNQKSKNNVL